MTAKEVSERTTVKSITEASDDALDHMLNCAAGHLRDSDQGIVRQMEFSIKAITDLRARRFAEAQNRATRSIAICAVIIAGFAMLVSLRKEIRESLPFGRNELPAKSEQLTR